LALVEIQCAANATAELRCLFVCSQTYSQGVMITAQPARRGMQGRHQISDGLRSRNFELLLLGRCDRVQIARYLPVTRRDEDQPFVLRAPA